MLYSAVFPCIAPNLKKKIIAFSLSLSNTSENEVLKLLIRYINASLSHPITLHIKTMRVFILLSYSQTTDYIPHPQKENK